MRSSRVLPSRTVPKSWSSCHRTVTAGSRSRRSARFATICSAGSSHRIRTSACAWSRRWHPARAMSATFVHSKVMIADDDFVRIGSANWSHRSMGFDTECDLAVESRATARSRPASPDSRSSARRAPGPAGRRGPDEARARRLARRTSRCTPGRGPHARAHPASAGTARASVGCGPSCGRSR